jgi:hypothetical protein
MIVGVEEEGRVRGENIASSQNPEGKEAGLKMKLCLAIYDQLIFVKTSPTNDH